jgi:hypothetical protein
MARWRLVSETRAKELSELSSRAVALLKSAAVLGVTVGPLIACNAKGPITQGFNDPIQGQRLSRQDCSETNRPLTVKCCIADDFQNADRSPDDSGASGTRPAQKDVGSGQLTDTGKIGDGGSEFIPEACVGEDADIPLLTSLTVDQTMARCCPE